MMKGCSITIEPYQEGYKAEISFDALSAPTTAEVYSRTITRRTKCELELAINDLIKSFPVQHLTVQKVTNFPMKSSALKYFGFSVVGIIVMLSIAIVGLATFSEQSQVIDSNTWDKAKAAAFFNNVGAPIVALMSYLALLYTLHQQNKSHEVSLEELALTRKELVDSTLAQKEQARTLNLQLGEAKSTAKSEKFDSTFYSLLDQHNKIQSELNNESFELSGNIRDIAVHFSDIHNSPNHCRYFRVLYQLLKFIAVESSQYKTLNDELFETKVKPREKFYSNIVRSMLADDLLYLLAANCYSPKGTDDSYYRYWQLIERYGLLEHLTLPNNMSEWFNGAFYDKNVAVFEAYTEKAFSNHLDLIQLNEQIERLRGKVHFLEWCGDFKIPRFKLSDDFSPSEKDVMTLSSSDGGFISEADVGITKRKIQKSLNNICRHYIQYHGQLKEDCIAKNYLKIILAEDLDSLLAKREEALFLHPQ
ncbi:putative phage abortive infection protein [Vibrio sp. 10N.261.51.C6]|uniref:putative phage abortive infection protein n=1 Tax=Vibrio sp. 10N.261.51.C6 TaxID=3229676 RepID=UPI00354D8DAC